MSRLHSFLSLVVEQKASDLHFHSGNVPLIRYNGDLIPLPFRRLTQKEARRFLFEIMTDEQKAELHSRLAVDFVYELQGVGRFRANVFLQNQGVSAVFRVIPLRCPTMDELMFPDAVRQLTHLNNGLVLVTGPTGSGKSTTLAAMVHEINATSRRHVITIEDPIEFIHEPIESTISHREVGTHTKSFGQALRSSLRESPDVLVIGEMRDAESVALALSAAETGVLVLATLHTNTASKAVHRIVDSSPTESREHIRGMLSFLLRGVLAQRLCKRADGDGRIALLEIVLQNYAISNMIRENKIHILESFIKSTNPHETGMQSLDRCVAQMIHSRIIDEEEGLRWSNDPRHVQSLLEQLRHSGGFF